MADLVKLALEDLLVDPRLSPRRTPVDEDYLDRLGEALAEGGELPPLRVARIEDRTAPWCACQNMASKTHRVEYDSDTRMIPYAVRPLMPEHVLYDGLTVFWALRRAGVKKHDCLVGPDPATCAADVTSFAAIANGQHGRKLEDADLREAFAKMWLGRAVRELNESWIPEKRALGDVAVVAQRLGKSGAWGSRMRVYCEVHQAVGLDLGFSRSCALGRLPGERWRGFCWYGETLLLHPILDAELRPVGAAVPVTKLSREQIERHVARELQAIEAGGGPSTGSGQAGSEQLSFADWKDRYFSGKLPAPEGWEQPREWSRTIFEAIPQMSKEQLAHTLDVMRPVHIDTERTWQRLRDECKRAGIEL